MPKKKSSSTSRKSSKKSAPVSQSMAMQISMEIWMISTFLLLLSAIILLNQTFYLSRLFSEEKSVIQAYKEKVNYLMEQAEAAETVEADVME